MIVATTALAGVLIGDKVQYKTPEGAQGEYEGLVFSESGDESVKLMTGDGNILYVVKKHVVKIVTDDQLPNREDRLKIARMTERNMILEREKMKLQKMRSASLKSPVLAQRMLYTLRSVPRHRLASHHFSAVSK